MLRRWNPDPVTRAGHTVANFKSRLPRAAASQAAFSAIVLPSAYHSCSHPEGVIRQKLASLRLHSNLRRTQLTFLSRQSCSSLQQLSSTTLRLRGSLCRHVQANRDEVKTHFLTDSVLTQASITRSAARTSISAICFCRVDSKDHVKSSASI